MQGLTSQILASLGKTSAMVSDKRRQQASRVVKRLSLEKLVISVADVLTGTEGNIIQYVLGENCMALRGHRADHA